MARLTLTSGNIPTQEFNLELPDIKIGRRSDNTVQLPDPSVSGCHARITSVLDKYFLEDLGSTNGTSINGKLIKKHPLKDSDLVVIGECCFRFSDQAINFQLVPAVINNHATENSNDSKIAKLRIINSDSSCTTMKLTRGLTTLGEPGIAVAAITRRAHGEFYIIDVESRQDN